jgi:hypothetical protein
MKIAITADSAGSGAPSCTAYRAGIIHQLSPAENQKECREKKARRENDSIVDIVFHGTSLSLSRKGPLPAPEEPPTIAFGEPIKRPYRRGRTGAAR